MYQKIVGCSKFHIQHISQDQIEKLKNFVVDMEEEHMELIQQKQIVKVTYATHWIQMENVQYANSIDFIIIHWNQNLLKHIAIAFLDQQN